MTSNATGVVTGASGFLAKHVVVQLLKAGYRVRGTVRSKARGELGVTLNTASHAVRETGRFVIETAQI